MSTLELISEKKYTLTNPFTNKKIKLEIKLKNNKIIASKLSENAFLIRSFKEQIEAKPVHLALKFFGRISCPIHYKYSIITSYEKLQKINTIIPLKAKFLRTIYLEFERILHHLNFLYFLIQYINFPILEKRILFLINDISNLVNVLIGKKKPYLIVGGVSNNLTINFEKLFSQKSPKLKKAFEELQQLFIKHPFLKSWFKDVGFLPRHTVKEFSLSGPLARSSALTNDIRKSDPYGAYDKIDFLVPVNDFCDLYGEILVLLNELSESLDIIKRLSSTLPLGNFNTKLNENNVEKGSIITRVEHPQGELFTYIRWENNVSQTLLKKYQINPPEIVKVQGLLTRLSGEKFDNFELLLQTLGKQWF